jgi:hypothetical protein
MKVNSLKPSEELAHVVLEGISPLVTKEPITLYEYVNKERTDKIKGFATDLVLTNQNFEKVRCITPNMPRLFLGGELSEPTQVELVNPIAEITYTNEIRLLADDIVLSQDSEVTL